MIKNYFYTYNSYLPKYTKISLHKQDESLSQFKRVNILYKKLGPVSMTIFLIVFFISILFSGYIYLNNQNLKQEISSINSNYSEIIQLNSELLEKVEYLEIRLEYYHLWTGEIELFDPIIENQGNEEVNISKYRIVAERIKKDIHEIPGLDEVFVDVYPDRQNGTAYIMLSNLNSNVTTAISELFNPSIAENIRFIQSPAPLKQLYIWKETMRDFIHKELVEADIQWTALGVSQGKILLGVTEITANTVETITIVIKEDVPPGIIVIWEFPKMEEL